MKRNVSVNQYPFLIACSVVNGNDEELILIVFLVKKFCEMDET